MAVEQTKSVVGLVLGALLLASCGDCGSTAQPPGAPPAERGVPPPGASAELLEALARSGLALEPPPGFDPLPVRPNERWAYQHAIKSRVAKLEIRFGVLPPADDYESLFAATVARLDAAGQLRGIGTFPYDSVREEFNAHWGGALSFDVHPQFASGYDRGLAVLIHRDGAGHGMFVGLFDELAGQVEWEWDRAFHALRFAEPIGKPPSPHAQTLAGSVWSCGDEGLVQMRFLESTWALVHVSAAHAVMGRIVPFETAYHEIEYLDASHFAATVFRVDNAEQGDRTPLNPKPQRYEFARDGDRLTLSQTDGPARWECQLIGQQ